MNDPATSPDTSTGSRQALGSPAGAKVWLHTGSGSSGAQHRYWGMGNYVWNNDGDTAKLKRANGSLADSCSYLGAGSYVLC